MEKQFVTYNIAKDLKELDYVEKCMGMFECSLSEHTNDDENTGGTHTWKKNELHFEKKFFINNHRDVDFSNADWIQVGAPLWQEVIDWFIKKFNWYLDVYVMNDNWVWQIFDIEQNTNVTNINMQFLRTKRSYKEAKEQVILKGIELIKNK